MAQLLQRLIPMLAAFALCLPPSAGAAQPMNPDMPMKGEMKKDGMKRGDVKKAAQKKKLMMEEMMEGERARKPPAK